LTESFEQEVTQEHPEPQELAVALAQDQVGVAGADEGERVRGSSVAGNVKFGSSGDNGSPGLFGIQRRI